MCSGCNTSSSTTSANPAAQAAYDDVISKAQSVASTPYQPYTGELVAPLNDGQNTAMGQLAGAYGAAQPFIREGNAYLNQGAQGLANVQNYLQAGSDATANVGQYQDQASNQYGTAAGYVGQSASALAGIKPYMDMAQGSYLQATGYGGMAAGAYGQELSGLGQVGSYLGKADGYFGQAAGLATPQDFNGADGVSKYMNPYTSSVINATMAQATQADAAQTANVVGNSIGSGAYGGDRNGIAVAALAGQQAMANNSTIAGLNQANFAQASNEFNTVQGQRQQGASILSGLGSGELQAGGLQLSTAQGYGNAGAGYAGLGQLSNATGAGYAGLAGVQGQTAQQLGNLGQISTGIGSGYNSAGQLGLGMAGMYNSLGTLQGTTGQAYGSLGASAANMGALNQSSLISGASAGLQAATLQQQEAQQQDTAAYNQYMAGQSYPFQQTGWLSNIVQGIASQEGNTQATQGNALSSAAGLATSGIGIMGATGAFGSNGYMAGLASNVGSMFSDMRVKQDIAPVGRTFDGQTMYRYRYKGDPTGTMHTGLMAQEVEGRTPDAVGSLGGVKTVNYERATDDAAALGLGARPGDARPGRAMGGPVGLGMSPMGGPTMPDFAGRPRFDDGGAAVPSGGISFGGMPGGGAGGLNVSPSALTGGAATAHAPQGLGMRSPVLTAAPASAQYAAPVQSSDGGSSGFGATPSFTGGSASGSGLGAAPPSSGSTQDPSSSGFSPGAASGADTPAPSGLGAVSQNGWIGVLAAGLGMMSGRSASAANNIGSGALGGLQTYLGLQQQDRNNAYQQSEMALRKQQADQTAAYQNKSLAQSDQQIALKVQEMHDSVERNQKQQAIESGQLANQTATTASENATRDQARQLQRYQQFVVPGDGLYYRDLLNPGAAPVRVGSGQGAPGATPAAGGVAPPTSFNGPSQGAPPAQPSAPPPTASAPPPQGGVPASGGVPGGGGAGFTSPMPGSAPALPSSFSGAPGAVTQPAQSGPAGGTASIPTTSRPQAGSAMTPVQVSQGWQPTTSVPRGYVPDNSMNIAMSGDGGKAQAEIGQKQVEGLQTSASKATNAQQQLYLMNSAVDALPKTGLIAPGALGDERAKLANSLNTIATTFGGSPVISPDQVANLQEVQKGAFRLGTQMITDTNGGREAGFILQNSVANVPSLNNSYLGFKRVAAGIDQANQYAIDKSNFTSDYYAKYHHTDGADALFNKLNPWQNYAQRAIDNSTMPTARPQGVPAGSQYSMTARMWRGPDGSLYGQNGQAVQQ